MQINLESATRKMGLHSVGPGDYRRTSDNLGTTREMDPTARRRETTEVALTILEAVIYHTGRRDARS